MDNYNIFDFMYPRKRITKKIRLIELFAGIGSQAKSLEILDKEGLLPNGFETYRVVEFDKYAILSYNAVHGTNFETQDITKIKAQDLGITEKDKYEYIMTYSFPCTDISGAGLGKGFSKGSGTRSGLLWEVERLLNECDELPQILLMENVPLVIGKNNIDDFEEWVKFLEEKGYSNYLDLLNAKNYGIPQNRNRCFMVSILGEWNYEFPKPIPLKLKLKDMLEEEVDEKYFLSEKMFECLVNDETKGFNRKERFYQTLTNTNINGLASAITTRAGSRPTDNYISDNLEKTPHNKKVKETLEKTDLSKLNDISVIDGFNRKVKTDELIPTLTEGYSYRNQDFILIKKNIDDLTNDTPKVLGGFGKIGSTNQYHLQNRIYDDKVGVALTTNCNPYYKSDLRIRKLTPCECWSLMGFSREDYEKASKVNSNAQLYKQAGNSIVVNVLVAIFKELL